MRNGAETAVGRITPGFGGPVCRRIRGRRARAATAMASRIDCLQQQRLQYSFLPSPPLPIPPDVPPPFPESPHCDHRDRISARAQGERSLLLSSAVSNSRQTVAMESYALVVREPQ